MIHSMLYEILYALAASGGREQALFGNCAPAARKAFARSCAGNAFPEIWFEIPLLGEPRFDLHALTSRGTLDPETALPAEVCGGFPDTFRWFACQGKNVRQLALSWDLKPDKDPSAAIQLLVADKDPNTVRGFLQAAGREDAIERYESFSDRLPEGLYTCYYGVFPERPGSSLRVECIPARSLQPAYAKDPELLRAHLAQVGIREFGDTLLPRCRDLADTPFRLEFQFDVEEDGSAGPVMGASLRFACPPGEDDWDFFNPDGEAGRLMDRICEWGLADDRWRLLGDMSFANRVKREEESCMLFCFTAFVKLRWRAGVPLDAKAYLMAGSKTTDNILQHNH